MTARHCFDRGEEVGIPSPLLEHYLVRGTSFAGVLAKMCGNDDPYVFVATIIAMTWRVLCLHLPPWPPCFCSFSGGNGKDN
jgi:hypothetical protein